MLDYEWGNPSNIMLTGNEDTSAAASDQVHRQIFDHYASQAMLSDNYLHASGPTLHTNTPADFTHHHHNHFNTQQQPQQQNHIHHHHHPFFDPRAFHGASSTSSYPPPQPPPPSMLSLEPLPQTCGGHGHGPGLVLVPKSEDVNRPMVDFVGSRIGLNLGGRTYFSSSEDDFVSRLYRRSRPSEPGSTGSSNSPRCQAEGCNADLSQAKHYHRRHKVCEFHSKAATVIAAGLTQRFCQQCSRFHLLSEFDNGKRSCRKRLADHNRRRRKTQNHPNTTSTIQDNNIIHKSSTTLENTSLLPRSPPESGNQSSSSVTVAVSPPDYFRQRSYHQSPSPSTTSSSMFFST